MRKLVGKILIISIIYMLSICVVVTYANTDGVPENHWADNVIEDFIEKKYIKQSKDNFIPDEELLMGELAMIANTYFAYGDIDSLEGNMILAQEKGYLSNAKVEEKVTREEVAVLICKILSLEIKEDRDTSFSDNADISLWAKQYVNKLQEESILKGYPDNSFKPKKYITKAEFVTILNRCFGIGGGDFELIDREIDDIEIGVIEYNNGEVVINEIIKEIVLQSGDIINISIAVPEEAQDAKVEVDITDSMIIAYDVEFGMIEALKSGETTVEFKALGGKYRKSILIKVN